MHWIRASVARDAICAHTACEEQGSVSHFRNIRCSGQQERTRFARCRDSATSLRVVFEAQARDRLDRRARHAGHADARLQATGRHAGGRLLIAGAAIRGRHGATAILKAEFSGIRCR